MLINKHAIVAITLGMTIISCGSPETSEAEDIVIVEEEPIIETEVIVEEPVSEWVITETNANEIELKSPVKETTEIAAEPNEVVEEEIVEEIQEEQLEEELEEMYEVITIEALNEALAEEEYEEMESTYVVEEMEIPLEEDQTLISYGKKGDAQAVLHVVSTGPNNEIQQIIFSNKNHTDEYNVQAGMTGKEVRKLRREVKHMVHKGQVFLYDDDSNIMYLMDAQNMVGDEITDGDIESMEVMAVIWKDKKHHKKHHKK